VWPDRVIEENNLQAHISTLHAAFGAERELIRTVAGRVYQFTGEIRVLPARLDERAGAGMAAAQPAAAQPATAQPPTNLPEPVSELIGRDEELRAQRALLGCCAIRVLLLMPRRSSSSRSTTGSPKGSTRPT
jgi:hypothetical protein